MKNEILLIEDDIELQKLVSDYLNKSGFICICADSIQSGKMLFEKHKYGQEASRFNDSKYFHQRNQSFFQRERNIN